MAETLAFQWTWLLVPLVGLIVGFYVSIIGGGGGVFFVPALTILFNIPTQLAVSTSLASIIPTTVVSAFSHRRQGNLDLRIGLILGIGGVFGALIGAYGSSLISSSFLAKIFGAFCIASSVPIIVSTMKRARAAQGTERSVPALTRKRGVIGLMFGIMSGVTAGFFGISGTPPIVVGLYIMGYPALTVVGTSVFVLIFNALSGSIGHLVVGQLNWMLVLLLSSGAATGAFLGPGLVSRVKTATAERLYGPLFIVLSLLVGILMLLK